MEEAEGGFRGRDFKLKNEKCAISGHFIWESTVLDDF
jgi:hypothetical protein